MLLYFSMRWGTLVQLELERPLFPHLKQMGTAGRFLRPSMQQVGPVVPIVESVLCARSPLTLVVVFSVPVVCRRRPCLCLCLYLQHGRGQCAVCVLSQQGRPLGNNTHPRAARARAKALRASVSVITACAYFSSSHDNISSTPLLASPSP